MDEYYIDFVPQSQQFRDAYVPKRPVKNLSIVTIIIYEEEGIGNV